MLITIVTALATIALAFITFLYLNETKKMRAIAQRSFQADLSPKVFLENIKFIPNLNDPKKEIEVTAVFIIKNAGKTQANNFIAKYTFSADRLKIEGEIKVPYLFPNQGVQYPTKIFGLSLNDANFAVAKEAQVEKKVLIMPEAIAPPIFLNLSLSYIDHEGKEQNIPYKIKYTFHNNIWNFITE